MAKRKRLQAYLEQYAREHTKLGTKLTHMVGIPLILASFFVLWVDWRVAGFLFASGWLLQLIGHHIEGNRPAFLSDPFYLLVGVVWVLKEIYGWLTSRPRGLPPG